MLTPAYKLTVGGKVVDTTDEPRASTVVELCVALDMDTPADSFTLTLGQVGGLRPERDDEATVELGYADDGGLTQVITGTVVAVEPGLTTTRVVGATAAHALLRTFVDQTYEGKTAGAMVRDLADQAGVDTASVDDGITFPAYVIDGRRSVHRHLRDLADLCGFDVYVDASGRLVFEPFAGGQTIHTLEYAKHVVALEMAQAPAYAGIVEAWGESSGGGHGEEGWAWLTKDFGGSRGTAGSGSPTLRLERSALRTPDAARAAASAAHTTIERRRVSGRVWTTGNPAVALGDAVRLSELPDATLNGTFQVRSVTHRLTKADGFVTGVGFRSLA